MDISDWSPPAAEKGAPLTIGCANPLAEWILSEGWNIPDPKALVRFLGMHLNALGIPVYRLRITIRTLHPQFLGITYTWTEDDNQVEEFTPPHTIVQEDRYLSSPYAAIFEGAGGIRRRLEGESTVLDFPILAELKEAGATDYVAMPLTFSDGRIAAITIATRRKGGFSTEQLATVDGAMLVLARIMEVHALRRTAETILQTYLGRQTGERVLKGLIKRGDGEDIHAVIWFCDLRDSTSLADSLPRPAFLQLLNDYFECTAGAVIERGGEVLKFIGDAVLAIFPIGSVTDHPELCPVHATACQTAIAAARDALSRIRALNATRRQQGQRDLSIGVALHLGDVTYGNIGLPQRLDFTVIGPAANEASRLEGMCKTLGRSVIISAELARLISEPLVSLGWHELRGVAARHEIFTLAE
jgi:adenylate cyclase